MKTLISIVICTRDRCESLKETIRSILAVSVPTDLEPELWIVDNASQDGTEQLVKNWGPTPFPMRHLKVLTPGKGHAYNGGLAVVPGEVLLFTDDDVRVPPNWIEGMVRPILTGRGDAVAGGVVFPPHVAYALSRAPLSSRRSWFASSEFLDPARPDGLIGANMAFHRRVLAKVPRFDTELGAGAMGFGEETLYSEQLITGGFKIVGALDTAVEHHFDLSRIGPARLAQMARNKGRSYAFIVRHWQHRRHRLPQLQFLVAAMRATWARLMCAGKVASAKVPDAVLEAEEAEAYWKSYLAEAKRPPKYEVRGLVALYEWPGETPCRES